MNTMLHAFFSTHEAQVCIKCGARYGECKHTRKPEPRGRDGYHRKSALNFWTQGEEDLMLEMLADGVSVGGIATRLSRSRAAVMTRLYALGVRGVGA